MSHGFRVFLGTVVGLVFVVILLPSIAPFGTVQVGWHLFIGWIAFLKRVIPQVTLNWSGIGMVVVCSILIVAGIHSLGSWLFSNRNPDSADAPTLRWRWTWSCATYGTLWLLFLAAIGITGVVHQTAWLMTTNVPLRIVREHRGTYIMHLKQYATELVMAAEGNGWALADTRQAFYKSATEYPVGSSRLNAIEDLQVLFFEGTKEELAAAVLFYRDPIKREKSGFVVIPRHGQYAFELKEITELASVLTHYQQKTPGIGADVPQQDNK